MYTLSKITGSQVAVDEKMVYLSSTGEDATNVVRDVEIAYVIPSLEREYELEAATTTTTTQNQAECASHSVHSFLIPLSSLGEENPLTGLVAEIRTKCMDHLRALSFNLGDFDEHNLANALEGSEFCAGRSCPALDAFAPIGAYYCCYYYYLLLLLLLLCHCYCY